MEPSTFLSIKDVARELTMSESGVRRHLDNGVLPSVTIEGRRLVPRAAIEELNRLAMEHFDVEKSASGLRR